jgi:BirA family biotin operon repressor/biotin-[acetyl-CoA-carboxylase] ligase
LPYRYHARCGSTNLLVKDEAASAPAGLLVVADEQTEGRGRLGRSWSSRPGEDLTFSVLLRPSLPVTQAPLLSLVASLAIAEVFEALPGLGGRVRVKWPNDVLIDEKKVCGVLLESFLEGERLQWALAGIGVNVNSEPVALLRDLAPPQDEEWRGKPHPTSLRAETGMEVARGTLLADLLTQLTLRWTQVGEPRLLDGLRTRDALLGRHVEVLAGPPDGALVVAGEAVGIGAQGELLVRDANGREVQVFAGEVTLRTGE